MLLYDFIAHLLWAASMLLADRNDTLHTQLIKNIIIAFDVFGVWAQFTGLFRFGSFGFAPERQDKSAKQFTVH